MTIRDPKVEAYISSCDANTKEIVEALVGVVFETIPGIQEAMRWNRITYTLHDNWNHWICGIEHSKNHVSLIFHKGVFLDDPDCLLQGVGKYLRSCRFNSSEQVAPKALAALLRQAVAHQTDMLDESQAP